MLSAFEKISEIKCDIIMEYFVKGYYLGEADQAKLIFVFGHILLKDNVEENKSHIQHIHIHIFVPIKY